MGWTREDAENALAAVVLRLEQPKPPAPGLTLSQAAERYLTAKARKRSVANDRRILEHFKAEFGKDTALVEITGSRISEYRAKRLTVTRGQSGQHLRSAVARLDTVMTSQKITQEITHEPSVETSKGSR